MRPYIYYINLLILTIVCQNKKIEEIKKKYSSYQKTPSNIGFLNNKERIKVNPHNNSEGKKIGVGTKAIITQKKLSPQSSSVIAPEESQKNNFLSDQNLEFDDFDSLTEAELDDLLSTLFGEL